MKKIVYLAYIDNDTKKGVIDKILSEKKSFERHGYNVKLFVFNKVFLRKDSRIEQIYLAGESNTKNLFVKLLDNIKLVNKVVATVKRESPNFIYLRDTMWFFGLHSKLSKIAPFFVEIQSNIFDELKITDKKRYIIENVLKRNYFRTAKGFVCITDEIYKIESKYNRKPKFILGNGIELEDANFIRKVESNGLINLLFIGSPNMTWHGLERLLKSFKIACNKDKFLIHIIGYENESKENLPNVRFYGYMKNKEEINKIFSICDIGIGTLELYKNKMNEAAPLKIRHYLAKGLPVIIGYDDVDLKENYQFILKVPNNNSIIDFMEIEKFYEKTKKLRASGDISRFAMDNLTWDNKISELVPFVEDVLK